jgi:hypothetical protein
VRLNLGCGDRYAGGWHNVDRADCPHRKDEAADLRDFLPWRNVTHAYAGHVLEHLRLGEVLVFLDRLRECMVPGGELLVVGPDVVLAEAMLAGGQDLGITLAELKYGGGRWPGDEHRWECAELDVMLALRFTGWVDVARVGIDGVPWNWPVAERGPRWQCAVSARSPL